MKRKYRIEILSEIIVETNGLIGVNEIMEEVQPLMHIKESKTGHYVIVDYQTDSSVQEIGSDLEEIMEV